MINSKKKGFTIVELVIVIAVIAVLAAVLIPTFSSLIKKANLSADKQAVRQMNVALVAGSVEGKPAGSEDVVDILAEAGYNSRAALIPVCSGYQFCWYSTENAIVLIDTNGKIIYPETLVNIEPAEGTLHNLANGYAIQNSVDNLEELKNVFTNIKAGDNVEIVINEAISFTEEIEIPSDTKVTLNLNGMTISSSLTENYPIYNLGELTIVGGTIDNSVNCAIRNLGTLTLEDVTVTGENSAIYSDGEVIINSGIFDGAVAVDAFSGSVVINGGTFTNGNTAGLSTSTLGESTVISAQGADVIINDGTFIASNNTYVINAMLNGSEGSLVINGGTFSGGKGIYFNGTIDINNGTFNCEIEAIAGFHVTEGTFSKKITINSWHDTNSAIDDRDIIITGGNFTYGDGQFIGDGSIDGTISGGTFNTTKDKLFEDNDFVYVDITGGSFKTN